MTRAEPTPLLARLENPESIDELVSGLRSLKHELIGHSQRKEAWISWGIIPILSKTLALSRSGGKRPEEGDGDKPHRTHEEEAVLQAVIILGSLALGGAPFVSPILASDVLSSMLSILASSNCPQWLNLPILKTLDAIADRYPLQNPNWPQDNQLAELVFSKEHVGSFSRVLNLPPTSQDSAACINLAAGIISKLCTEEAHKVALAESGALDALAANVASFVVAQGFVLPGAERRFGEAGTLPGLPPPAPPGAKLAPILRAVSVIVEHSKSRAELFLSSPPLVTVFPSQIPEFSPADIKKNPWGMPYLSGSAVPRQATGNPIDAILPVVPMTQPNSCNSNFPPLVPQGYGKRRTSFLESLPADEDETYVVPWLLYVIRAHSGMTRLMAARLVTALFRLGFVKKHRISMLSHLVVPILLRMLEKDVDMKDEDDPKYDGLIPTTLRLKEEAPSILATMVMDNQELQKHAVDGKAIKVLSQLLKETYNPFQETTRSMWYAEGKIDASTADARLKLGPAGFNPIIAHIMRYREGILKALAALAPFKDEYRKAICDNGVVPYIIDSLKPRSSTSAEDSSNLKNTAADGNPIPTLLAACGAARTLTRSASALRTSLIDAGVATPLCELIKHREIQVQIAATSVICNLALDFSPMKEALISADILPILCDHAHSNNLQLRLESLWALKNIAYNSANDIKIQIVKSLGPEWLAQLMSQDLSAPAGKQDAPMAMETDSPLGMGTSNSAGEQVDLLNPAEDSPMEDAIRTQQSSRPRQKRQSLVSDLDQSKQARQDSIIVQEQAFELIRNIICGSGASEMVDYIFQELRQHHYDLLEILAEKLRPRGTAQSRRDTSKGMSSVPVEVLLPVTYVLVNIAACSSQHREILLAHHDLMRNLMAYFSHPNRYVRVNCVWTIINLAYEDDPSDHQACYERASKLRALGAMDRLTSLSDDPDLDVRERTKTALHLMRKLVG